MSDATKILVLAEPDDDGRAVADGDDRVRLVRRDQHEREEPAQLRERAANRGGQAVAARISCSTRCATISVSVSVTNVWPSAVSSRFSSR